MKNLARSLLIVWVSRNSTFPQRLEITELAGRDALPVIKPCPLGAVAKTSLADAWK